MIPNENRTVLFNDSNKSNDENTTKFRIIHFNDVYNIEGLKQEPCGGASRFLTVIDSLRKETDSLLFFSGDALSPSTMSLFAKGSQMVETLNEFKLDAAAIGNHEFDMGVNVFEKLIEKSNFPWVLSNVYDADTGEPFMKANAKLVLNINNVKVGIIALAEKEWLKALSCVNYEEIIYEPFVEISKKLAHELKNQDKVDIVIALTHMRWDNDRTLAKKVPEIDLILGGHDHDYKIEKVEDHWIIKSGTDFMELSVINVELNRKPEVKRIEKIIVDSKIGENYAISKIVDKYLPIVNNQLDKNLGYINAPLDGRTSIIRTQETNLGNFFCDIIMSSVQADCALLNGGSFRSDRIHPKGPFKARDLRDILSFDSELIVLSVTGKEIHKVLEHGVAKYNEGGGRFPQVSHLFFAFDPKKPPGSRIDPKLIKINNQYIDMEQSYRLATNVFMRNVDDILKHSEVMISNENIPFLYILVENYFDTIYHMKKYNFEHKHRLSIISKSLDNELINELTNDPEIFKANVQKRKLKPQLSFHGASLIICQTLKAHKNIISRSERKVIKESEKYKEKKKEYELKSMKLAPEVEGRSILIENEQVYKNLLNERDLHEIQILNECNELQSKLNNF